MTDRPKLTTQPQRPEKQKAGQSPAFLAFSTSRAKARPTAPATYFDFFFAASTSSSAQPSYGSSPQPGCAPRPSSPSTRPSARPSPSSRPSRPRSSPSSSSAKPSWRSRFLRRSLLRSGLSLALLRRRLLIRRRLLRLIHQPHQRHRRRITRTRIHAQDLRVTTRTRLEARAEALEQLHHHFRIAQLRERAAAIRDRCRPCPSVISGSTTRRSSFAFGTVVLDRLMTQQRRRHVAEHGPAMRGVAAQLPAGKLVTHCSLLSHFCFKSRRDRRRASG